jgi:hypothetical protein
LTFYAEVVGTPSNLPVNTPITLNFTGTWSFVSTGSGNVIDSLYLGGANGVVTSSIGEIYTNASNQNFSQSFSLSASVAANNIFTIIESVYAGNNLTLGSGSATGNLSLTSISLSPSEVAAGYTLVASGNIASSISAVPEPSNYALMFIGLGFVGLLRRRRF